MTNTLSNNDNNESKKKSWFSMSYEERWSPSSLQQVASIWSLDEERDVPNLLLLKESLCDLKEYHLNEPLEVARCYCDAKFHLTTAEDKFRAMVKFRQREGLDTLLTTSAAAPPPLYVPTYYPSCFLDGVDKDGDPIWFDRIGASDVAAVYQQYGPVPFRDYTLWVRENGMRGDFAKEYERRHGRPPARVTAILDFDGLCRRHLLAAMISPLEEGIHIYQTYYGSMAKRIIITKAPFVFRIVWSIAQHFCSDQLKKTIVFCNTKITQATLDRYIDRSVLPPVLCADGGRGKPGVGFERCGNLEGGVMPEHLRMDSYENHIKLSASSDTVNTYDSLATDQSPPTTPVSSYHSHTATMAETTTTTKTTTTTTGKVRATPLASGYIKGDDRVILEL
jgi:CRAL/TRIO domain